MIEHPEKDNEHHEGALTTLFGFFHQLVALAALRIKVNRSIAKYICELVVYFISWSGQSDKVFRMCEGCINFFDTFLRLGQVRKAQDNTQKSRGSFLGSDKTTR